MDIVITALVGTGQAGNQDITTQTPVDTLTAQLSGELERKLLLAAGAWAIYRQAGRLSATAPAAPAPSESETLIVCSPKAAQLIDMLLQGDYHEQSLEALARLQNAHLRLPYNMLTLALEYGAKTKEARAILAPALGVRGRWLSHLNPAWSWVSHYLAETTQMLPDDAKTIWQEGTQNQRTEILRRLRQIDPARAREWLAAVWKVEKADARNEFLDTFTVNLSLDDEQWLEQALDDRSSNVRYSAAFLLARLPASALVQRMQARADSILSYSGNELIVTLPKEFNQEWERDGISENTSNRKGKRASWMADVLSQVPPQHWEERFGLTPQQLIEAVARTEWNWEIIESWSKAALIYHNTGWITPLLDWWYSSSPDTRQTRTSMYTIKTDLLSSLPQKAAEQKILQIRENDGDWMDALPFLPKPWSKEFGDSCLQVARDYLRSLTKDSKHEYNWTQFLTTMITALPPSCFDSALQPWELPDHDSWNQPWMRDQWKNALSAFEIRIDIRKRILEEIQ